jgi:transglutaminase-like putative cysteine protease
MRLTVQHTTSYLYDAPVDYGLQQVRLTPKEREGQKILRWDISVEGGHKQLSFIDHNANHVDLISIDAGGDGVVIHVKGEVETSDTAGIIGRHRGFMALWMFKRPTLLTTPGSKIRALLKELGSDFENEITRAHALSRLIVEHVPYATGRTDADTDAEQAVIHGAGVCQDHAHIFITAMRLLGHPARYVSGYLMMNDRVNQDATHAWAEAWFDNIGWVGFDVSNGYSPDDRYIRVATGLDYNDASPSSGMRFGPTKESMLVQLQVQQ